MLRRLTLFWLLACAACSVRAQEEAAPLAGEKFEQQSLALRTALFHEPSLEQPLLSLLDLYRKASREEELLGLYRSHIAQYPEDAGSTAVLVRLLLELKRPEASAAAQAAAEQHPQYPLALYLRHRDLEAQRDPRSLEMLERAIEAADDPARRREWTDELAAIALAENRRDLAEKHLRALAAQPGQTPAHLTTLAQRLNRDGFYQFALETAQAAAQNNPPPETAVELELQAAAAEAGLGQKAEAGARLDALLGKTAPDYARRPEIVSRRVALLDTDAERAERLKAGREALAAQPSSEAAALDLGELLAACEMRGEALKVLREAAARMPQSERLEKAALGLLDRLGDERTMRDFLRERLAAQPGRADLAWRLAQALYALGSREEGAAQAEEILNKLPASGQSAQRLQLARSLRRMGWPAESAAQLEKVLAADPKRLDVRRELAEAHLAAGDRAAAQKLMRESLDENAAIENFLDVVGFMMAQQQWPEAREALAARLAREPKNFEVAMLLIDVLGRLGEQKEGEQAIERTRALADTDARYRRWLEAAQAFAEEAGTGAAFFAAEQARLAGEAEGGAGGWTAERARRYLTLCEVARQGEAEPQLIEAVKARLAEESLPLELRVPLLRLLAEAMKRDPKNAVEAQNYWQELAAVDPERADEYRLRLARAMQETAQAGSRLDPVRALLETVRIAAINDAALLRGADKLFIDYGVDESALAVLEKLTRLEPEDLGHWGRWIRALAGMGDEERLRDALRQVLAGVGKEPVSEEAASLLRDHLVDSYWRSVASFFAQGGAEAMGQALPLLDMIERVKKLDAEQLWVVWARGYALRQLGRDEAATETAAQLETLARQWLGAHPQPPRLLFPDGLVMSLDQALATLREAPAPTAAPAESPLGPDSPPAMRWGFRTDDGALITQVLPVGGPEGSVLVLDQGGVLHALEKTSGKLRWRREGLWNVSSAPPPRARGRRAVSASGYFVNDGHVPLTAAPRLALEPGGQRMFLSHEGKLAAFSPADGAVLWRAELDGVPRRLPPQPGANALPGLTDEVFVDDAGRVILWRAETAQAAAFHPETGKLLWQRSLELPEAPPTLGPLNTGASCAANRLLVYGHQACVLDTATGGTLWAFDAAAVREFPLELKAAEDTGTPSAAPAPAPMGRMMNPALNPPRRLAMNYLRPRQGQEWLRNGWMENKGALVAPAVAWTQQNWQALGGEISRSHLLLSMPGLTLAPSLALPMESLRFEKGGGTFAGFTSGRAVYFNAAEVQIIDLPRKAAVTVPLAAVQPGQEAAGQRASGGAVAAQRPVITPEAIVAGPRVFATGSGGLLAVNPLTGRVLYAAPWPEPVRRWARLDEKPAAHAAPGAAMMAGRAMDFTPRFLTRSSMASSAAFRPRHAADGGWLFAVLGTDCLVALAPE